MVGATDRRIHMDQAAASVPLALLPDSGRALHPGAGLTLTRRRVLQLGALATAAAALPLAATPTAQAATLGYAPTYLRFAFSGNPSEAGTERWQWQGLQGDRVRPPMSQVAQQFVYATVVRRSSDPTGITQCMRPTDVRSEWLLRDSAGRVITRNSDPDNALDVGNPEFRNAAADFLVAKCRNEKWSGVLMDELNSSFGWGGWPSTPANYPTDAAYQDALVGFVQVLASRLHAAGFRLAGNLGTVNNRYLSFCQNIVKAGVIPNSEYFVAGGDGSVPASIEDGRWSEQVSWLEWSLANGSQTLSHDKQTAEGPARYGLSTFLLVDNGKGVYGADVAYSASTTYPQCFADALRLGSPLGARRQVQSGVWRRDFTNGSVIVNASRNATTYAGRALPGTSAALTLGTGAPPPTSAPPPVTAPPPVVPPVGPPPSVQPDFFQTLINMLLNFIRALFLGT